MVFCESHGGNFCAKRVQARATKQVLVYRQPCKPACLRVRP